MNFHWPGAFLLLGLIPLLAFAYFLRQRRRRKYAVRFSSLTLVRSAIPAQSTVRRWLPLGLFFLAIAVLAIAVARPEANGSGAGGTGNGDYGAGRVWQHASNRYSAKSPGCCEKCCHDVY